MPILGFAPGMPSNTPGIVTECDNWIPYDAGMEAAPSCSDLGYSAVPATATGAVAVRKVDGTNRTFVGTDTKLYEYTGGTWVDQSQSASAYATGSVWSFTQFGDATIASNYVNPLQASSSSSFSAIVGAPSAKIVESVVTGSGGFVFAFNTSSFADEWYCSGINDHTDWSVNAAVSGCNKGRLLGGDGGGIVAAKRFGAESIVAYKQNSLYHAQYVGGPTVWAWREVPEVGAVGARSIANIGIGHFIVSRDGFFVYDGARPVRIGAEVRDWWTRTLDNSYADTVEVNYDQRTNRVFIFFRPVGSAGLSKALVYHLGTQQWGLLTQNVETTLQYLTPGVSFASDSGTYDGGSDDPYDSGPANTRQLSVIDTSHKLCTLSGTPGTSRFQGSDVGDVNKASRVTEVFLEYAIRPQTASCVLYTSFALGGVEFVGTSAAAHDEIGSSNMPGRFTVRAHGRYVRPEFTFTGQCRVTGYAVPLKPTGSR